MTATAIRPRVLVRTLTVDLGPDAIAAGQQPQPGDHVAAAGRHWHVLGAAHVRSNRNANRWRLDLRPITSPDPDDHPEWTLT